MRRGEASRGEATRRGEASCRAGRAGTARRALARRVRRARRALARPAVASRAHLPIDDEFPSIAARQAVLVSGALPQPATYQRPPYLLRQLGGYLGIPLGLQRESLRWRPRACVRQAHDEAAAQLWPCGEQGGPVGRIEAIEWAAVAVFWPFAVGKQQ